MPAVREGDATPRVVHGGANEHRANQAIDGQTPAGFGRDSPPAEVISLDEVRRRTLVRRSFAHGLLNAWELMDDEQDAA